MNQSDKPIENPYDPLTDKTQIGSAIRTIDPGTETIFDIVPRVVTKYDGTEVGVVAVKISRRELQPEPAPEPRLAPSPRRSHVFLEAEGFSEYLNRYGKKGHVVILFDPAADKVVGILDETAERGFEVVELHAQIDPAFAPWAKLLSQRVLPIMEFADFLMQHRTAITEPDGRELALLLRQVKAATNVALHSGMGSGSTNGLLVTSTIQAQMKTDEVDLPEFFDLELPLYIGTYPIKLRVDLLVDTVKNGSEIIALVSCSDLPRRRKEAFQQMIESIEVEDAIVTLGRAGWDDWDYMDD